MTDLAQIAWWLLAGLVAAPITVGLKVGVKAAIRRDRR